MAVQYGLIADMPAKIGGSFQEGRRNALAMQAAQQEQQMNALRMQQAQQEMGNQNALREAYRMSGGDMGKLQETLKSQGMYEPAMKIQGQMAAQQKADLEAKKAELEGHAKRIEYTAQVLSSSHDQASHDANLAQLAQEIGEEHIQNVPKVFNPQELQFLIKKGMTVKDQAYQQMRAIDQAQRQQQLAQTATYQQAQLGLAGQAGQRQEQELGLKAQEAQRKAQEIKVGKGTPQQLQADAQEMDALIEQAKPLLEKATGSYLGKAYSEAKRAYGGTTEGSVAAGQLKVIGGAIVSKMPKPPGPASDRDIQLAQEQAAQLGDPTVPNEEKKAALEELKKINARQIERAKQLGMSTDDEGANDPEYQKYLRGE
jgi:hypothetical protein